MLAGIVVGIVSLVLSLGGWPIDRLWFYLLSAAMASMLGGQLVLFWLVMQILSELSQRHVHVSQDLEGKPVED